MPVKMNSLLYIYVLVVFVNVSLSISPRYSLIYCHRDTDCIQDAYCKDNKYCTCKSGYVPDKNMSACIEEAKSVGDPCIKDIQCTAGLGLHSECFINGTGATGKCRCSSNAHFKDNLCHVSVPLGKYCHVSAECKVKSNISVYCNTGVCVCPLYHHPNDDATDCLASSIVGDPCRNKSDCVAPNSVCLNICRCKMNFIVSYDSRRCLQVAERLGSRCEEDIQCQATLRNTVCDTVTQRCQCSNSSHHKDGICWNISGLGESCNDTRECVIPSKLRSAVRCDELICKCSDGFKEKRSKGDCVVGSGAGRGLFADRSPILLLMILNLWLLLK